MTQALSSETGLREQIKSRERVRDLAEVNTHKREVEAMLDLVPDKFPNASKPGNTDCTFLEPACGDGNFLVEILRRKLRYVTPRRYGRGERFEHRILRALSSIYGIDLSEDNVQEARARLRVVVERHIDHYCAAGEASPGFRVALEVILGTNVIWADALRDQVELVDYRPGSRGTFEREWFSLDSVSSRPKLFSATSRRDQTRLHYSKLANYPSPIRGAQIEDEVA